MRRSRTKRNGTKQNATKLYSGKKTKKITEIGHNIPKKENLTRTEKNGERRKTEAKEKSTNQVKRKKKKTSN